MLSFSKIVFLLVICVMTCFPSPIIPDFLNIPRNQSYLDIMKQATITSLFVSGYRDLMLVSYIDSKGNPIQFEADRITIVGDSLEMSRDTVNVKIGMNSLKNLHIIEIL